MLIDAIIRQTMVLVARLAISQGQRTPLTHLANQVFLDLNRELRAHKVGTKVIADMFGLTLRAYYQKLKRLKETGGDRNRSLWQAVVSFLLENTTVSRAEVLGRFPLDDYGAVSSILNDLVDNGLMFKSGKGPSTLYRPLALNDAESTTLDKENGLRAFLWTLVYRAGPISLRDLGEQFPGVAEETIERLLKTLEDEDKIVRDEDDRYCSTECVLKLDAPEGWEAAVFDHFQAVANVIARRSEIPQGGGGSLVGGSTFHYDLDEAHPLQDEVLRFFKRFREEGSELRGRVDEYNRTRTDRAEHPFRVVLYAGQNILPDGEDEENNQ